MLLVSSGCAVTKIGLCVHQLILRRSDNFQNIPLAPTGLGSELNSFLPTFIKENTDTNQLEQTERSWRLLPQNDVGRGKHGIIRYGTFGYGSDIVSQSDGALKLRRTATDVEEIPLYYQFWIPESGNVGFSVLQSFRDRSCVRLVLSALIKSFNERHENLKLTAKRVMPTDDKAYSSTIAKKLILSKKKVPKDRAEILRNLPSDELDVELSITSKGRAGFGLFTDLQKSIKAAAHGAAFVLDGIEFDEASATVKVGGGYKKVSIIGPSNSAGVIDVTDEVELDEKLHPTFDSVADIATKTIEDFRYAYGMK